MRAHFGIFGIFAALLTAHGADAATHITPLSQYGQIQNVQNYSSNPYWNPNGPYNQKFPQPVYVTGPDLNSGDCDRTVSALISSFCAANNNCYGMQLSDIRPGIMLQLSRLPGHNWATQCMGYIDDGFSKYQSMAQNRVPAGPVSFPNGPTIANPDLNTSEFKIKNPFSAPPPKWAQEMQELKQELKDLQSENGAGDNHVVKADFPQTFDDLPFATRMNILADGYEVYKDKSPYDTLSLLPADNTTERDQDTTQSKRVTKQAATQPSDTTADKSQEKR